MRKTMIGVMVSVLGVLALSGCSHEAADWKAASSADSSEAYQQFLKQYPHSANAAQAQGRLTQLLEDRDWQTAAAADTRTAYEQFVAQHPESKWSQEARIRIENFAQGGATTPTAVADAAGNAGAAPPSATGVAGSAAQSMSSAPTSASASAGSPPARSAVASATHARSAHAATRPAVNMHARDRDHLVQLGAYRTRSRAESQWKLLRARYPQLKTARPHYVAVHSRGGEMYRLQVELSSAKVAKGLCSTLKRHAQSCVRVSA
jgi:cell division protein FtsN